MTKLNNTFTLSPILNIMVLIYFIVSVLFLCVYLPKAVVFLMPLFP